MNVILTVLLTLLMFGIIIFAHEFGHLLCAKKCHIYVEEFSVGMGPKLFAFHKGETQYTLRLFPIGGYCKMPGEDGESEHPNGFDKKSVPQRMLVVAGGALFNFIFAILLFIVAYMALGTPVNEARIGEVTEGMPAAEAGMLAGDEITAINGESVDTWAEAVTIINANEGNELTFTVDRDGESLSFQIVPELSEDGTQSVIGIVRDSERLSLFGAIQLGFQQTYDLTKLILVSLFDMVTGQADVELAGPVGVGQMVGQVANYGLLNFIIFIAAISVNLGVVNLLPLPALDGSRLVFLAIEGLRGKPVSAQVEGTIHFVGFVLLMGLMIVITFFDVSRIVG
ncbi:MAG TPA: RIP metalloprotease RseP [Firmicutes bacterium]|nr:RIP metalloprotease RseP [Bacillota bacterium]